MKGFLFFSFFLMIFFSGCFTDESGSQPRVGDEIQVKGSDTMVQLVSNFAEAYSENRDVRLSVTGGGSGTGIAALINGEVDIANSSRPIRESEIELALERGIEPIELIVALDALSVIVNSENPVNGLSLDQISRIYKGDISNWMDVGGPDLEITLYGRQSTSGTYVYFMEEIVKEDYSAKMRNLEGNQAIIDAVKQDSGGIGYVGVGYAAESGKVVSGIKVLGIKNNEGVFVSPLDSGDNEYPVSRALYQYLARVPEENTVLHDFLLFELGDDGQKIVSSAGFLPITLSEKEKNRYLIDK